MPALPPRLAALLMILLSMMLASQAAADTPQSFEIRVIDAETGRGIPLVELRTTADARYYTDNAGRVAFLEPGMMNQPVFFHITSHGYRHPPDAFGNDGRAIEIEPSGEAVVELERRNIAERLYRVTGAGLFRESVLLGHEPPLQKPLLNAEVAGQDSVQSARYNGRIYWFWGDTDRVRYPLGNFRTTGATSPLPQDDDLPRDVGINLTYFTNDEGFVRPMAPLPSDDGNLIWISGLTTVADHEGGEHLIAHYSHRASLAESIGHGLLVFNDDTERFDILQQLDPAETWRHPIGQATRYEVDGEPYLLFVRPWPLVRVRDDLEAVQDPQQYEAFTCLAPGTTFKGGDSTLDRDADGNLVWGWKPDTEPINQQRERELIEAELMTTDEARFQLRDVDTDEPVTIHRSAVNWNAHLESWVLIGTEIGGRSHLGEVWLAHADAPTGPWTWARRIVTHDRYSFYNPAHHTFMDEDNGRVIYFEGTYTKMFSGQDEPTPYYDYNQIMYRLDLDHPRLNLPLQP